MALTRPTLPEIIARVKGDIASRSQGSPYIQVSVERILAYALAGLTHGLYGQADWTRKQLLPTTCEIEGLLAWGVCLDLPRKGSTTAAGEATFTGTNGVTIPEGTSVQSADGTLYTVQADVTVSGGVATVDVLSDDTGLSQNLEEGATLTLVTPIAGIDSEGEVSADITGGTDIEETEDYRARILQNFRKPPSGGGPGDYVSWALECDGVTRAWEFGARMGYGTVSVGFVMDGREDIIPLSGDVTTVQEYINARHPIDMRAVYVVAPVAKPVNMTIELSPDTADIRTAVEAELTLLFQSTELEVALAESRIAEAISISAGEDSHEITAISSLVPSTWEILTLGTITWA